MMGGLRRVLGFDDAHPAFTTFQRYLVVLSCELAAGQEQSAKPGKTSEQIAGIYRVRGAVTGRLAASVWHRQPRDLAERLTFPFAAITLWRKQQCRGNITGSRGQLDWSGCSRGKSGNTGEAGLFRTGQACKMRIYRFPV
jgi:hypothetical protein